ncbi:hypothetical protein HK102_003528 [Quaeritorhiza haematococci]|nr:hypothetical protein HK102_003528 [Quaeritorhiza haematococci]
MTNPSAAIFKAFLEYDFNSDEGYQKGLASIQPSLAAAPKEEAAAIVEKAKWFYYSKFVNAFDYDQFLKWKCSGKTSDASDADNQVEPPSTTASSAVAPTDPSATTSSTSEQPRYPKSFFELVEMIQKGEPIPGIRQIPNKLNESPPSSANLKPRKKPWEVATQDTEVADATGSS